MDTKKISSILKAIYQAIYPSWKINRLKRYTVTSDEIESNNIFIKEMRSQKDKGDILSSIWFCPQIDNIYAGGAATIFMIADHLSKSTGCINYFAFPIKISEYKIQELQILYPKMNFKILCIQECNEDNSTLPYFDAAFCTFWLTAFDLVKFNKCRKKFYLIQDEERLFYHSGTEAALVDESYRFGFNGLANSQAIQNRYKEISGANCHRYIPGINNSLLEINDYISKNERINIIVYARPSHHRNMFELLGYVFSRIAITLKEKINITFIGEDFNPKEFKLPPSIKVRGNITDKIEMKDIYNQCDIGVCMISTPTISYQQLDFLASGRCLVATKNGEIESQFSEDSIYYVSALPDVMIQQVLELIKNREKIQLYAKNGREAVKNLSWQKELSEITNFIQQ